MSSIRVNTEEADAGRRKIFIVVGIVTAVIVAALVYWATRPGGGGAGGGAAQLEGATRPDSPEWAQVSDRIVVEFIPDQDAFESARAAGDIVMTMRPNVRNFTGRTLTGLELKVTVVDLDNNPVRERTAVVIPNAAQGVTELEHNRATKVQIMMEGFKPTDVRANIRVEKTAFRLR